MVDEIISDGGLLVTSAAAADGLPATAETSESLGRQLAAVASNWWGGASIVSPPNDKGWCFVDKRNTFHDIRL